MQSGAVATLGAQQSDDGGYISPEFDLPDVVATDEEEEMAAPPSKKIKFGSSKTENKSSHKYLLDEEEELALRLLGRSWCIAEEYSRILIWKIFFQSGLWGNLF